MRPRNCMAVFVTAFIVFTVVITTVAVSFKRSGNRAVCDGCNLVIVSIDTLRADNLPCYGYYRDTMPNLCAFARKHALFTRSYSQSSFTLDSHVSIFTSLFPSSHGVIDGHTDVLNGNIVTLPMLLRRMGYQTIFVGESKDPSLGSVLATERFGFSDVIHNPGLQMDWDRGIQMFRETTRQGKPAFLFLHTYMVHAPYLTGNRVSKWLPETVNPQVPVTEDDFVAIDDDLLRIVREDLRVRLDVDNNQTSRSRLSGLLAALSNIDASVAGELLNSMPFEEHFSYLMERYRRRYQTSTPSPAVYMRALYDERLSQADESLMEKLRPILSDRSLMSKTVIVITSDHGEAFMEHGAMEHDTSLYVEETHVPLIIAAPGLPSVLSDTLVQGIDIYPTVAALLGIRPPEYVQGKDLSPFLRGLRHASGSAYVFGEREGGRSIRSAFDGRYRLHVRVAEDGSRTAELYDTANDPDERVDVSSMNPALTFRMLQAMEASLSGAVRFEPEKKLWPSWIDDGKREQLMDHGYF